MASAKKKSLQRRLAPSSEVMDVLMPNGKKLRDCTFREIGVLSERLTHLADTPVRELSGADKLFMGRMLLLDDEMSRLLGQQPRAEGNIFGAMMGDGLRKIAREAMRPIPDKTVVKKGRGPNAGFIGH